MKVKCAIVTELDVRHDTENKAQKKKKKKGVPSDAPNCNMCYKITLQSEQ